MSPAGELIAADGVRWRAVPDGSFVPGPGHEEAAIDGRGRGTCTVCGEDWPCPSDDYARVWFEDEDRPDDAVPLFRLERIGPPESAFDEADARYEKRAGLAAAPGFDVLDCPTVHVTYDPDGTAHVSGWFPVEGSDQ